MTVDFRVPGILSLYLTIAGMITKASDFYSTILFCRVFSGLITCIQWLSLLPEHPVPGEQYIDPQPEVGDPVGQDDALQLLLTDQ